jgi:O-glycosyl hydrolase
MLIAGLFLAGMATSLFAYDATISWNDTRQRITGFGASGAFGMAGSLQNMAEPARTNAMKALFDTATGAGLTMIRNKVEATSRPWAIGHGALTRTSDGSCWKLRNMA